MADQIHWLHKQRKMEYLYLSSNDGEQKVIEHLMSLITLLSIVCIGQIIPEVFDQYKSVGATLNVMPFCTQFIPMEVINAAEEGSIIYHPSILPKHRGASAINWTLMEGDHKAGFTIFWADDGLDTGPILLQRTCDVDINDTVDTLYNRFLFPEGIRAMVNKL